MNEPRSIPIVSGVEHSNFDKDSPHHAVAELSQCGTYLGSTGCQVPCEERYASEAASVLKGLVCIEGSGCIVLQIITICAVSL